MVGLGLDGNEALLGRTSPKFSEVYARAGDLGFGRTAHAGESSGPEGVWDALEYLHLDRVDHGVRSIEDPALLEHLAAGEITLNVTPTSNVITGLYPDVDHHPVGPLIEAGTDLRQMNMSGLTPLQLAAYVNPNPVVIRTLLKAGADVNAPNYRGETPLHLAARHNGNPAVLAILLEAGADIDAVTNDGKTARDLAQENPRLKGNNVLRSTAP